LSLRDPGWRATGATRRREVGGRGFDLLSLRDRHGLTPRPELFKTSQRPVAPVVLHSRDNFNAPDLLPT
jgi:hypothetical protein